MLVLPVGVPGVAGQVPPVPEGGGWEGGERGGGEVSVMGGVFVYGCGTVRDAMSSAGAAYGSELLVCSVILVVPV